MPLEGWKQLLTGTDWLDREGRYPIVAYSEFMPPPRLGCKPYGHVDAQLFADDDPWGWRISEYEQALELNPGLQHLAQQILHVLSHLGRREPAHGIAKNKLKNNPYWPADLAEHGAPAHERYVVLMPLAISRTQDDKGRVRWTLFGGSEQGPAKAFWRGFFTAPGQELPAAWALDFVRRLLAAAYGESLDRLADLHAAGFRIYCDDAAGNEQEHWSSGALPSWTEPLRWSKGHSLRAVHYLLTFEPFSRLPAPVRRAYLAGELHLLPFPGSLVFWGVEAYLGLAKTLPLAAQIPLLHSFERHEAPGGIRVPQSGWLHEPRPGVAANLNSHGPLRERFQRTNRWARVHRHEDELAVTADEDKVAHVLFSTAADDLGLYGKPMARNSQIWTHEFKPLLDGPHAEREQLIHAAGQLAAGGLYGYRFMYPAMRVGKHEVYWQRPLVAYLSAETGQAVALPEAPLGYLTAYHADRRRPEHAVELWPRLLQRADHQAAVSIFDIDHDHHYHRTTINVRKILDTWDLLGRAPLARDFGRQLLTLAKHESLDAWLDSLPQHTVNLPAGRLLAEMLQTRLAPAISHHPGRRPKPPVGLTFKHTARRSFETAYWNTIAELSTGQYVNKDNADCVQDHITQERLKHYQRDLEALGDHLIAYYTRVFAEKKMAGKAIVGDLPFRWQTDFDFNWSGGWVNNQHAVTEERDIVCVIPGRDRRRAVIMADHYDTAYMEDVFGYGHGGGGPRLAAAGADDNHSATAALMLGAPIFLELSKAGKLACDVWLVHLTGEEFPSDCLGARHLCQRVVEGALKLRLPNGKQHDLSKTRVQGVYVLDMVAHNNDRDRDVFQICPGASRDSMWLALQAHRANHAWNILAPVWNRRPARRDRARGRRSADGETMPEIALHPQLSGEVRPPADPRSTLYNTDGQIFSDAGVPVVLFMENYDINRQGYHDTHDTLANIDLDYGAAVAAIAIESVARAATETPPWSASARR
jgi:hypothetical protein